MRLRDKIQYAQALAEFVNLKPCDVAAFRRHESEQSDFVPASWWDYRPTDLNGKPSNQMQWQMAQELLREAWQKRFRIGQFELMGLLTSVFDPTFLTDVMLGSRSRPAFASRNEMPEEMYPYQQAVLFLAEQKWRAKRCERCKAPFAANHSVGRYCNTANENGQTCASLSRTEDKERDRLNHQAERNARRRNKYAEAKRRGA
jgi:hypothetical protein